MFRLLITRKLSAEVLRTFLYFKLRLCLSYMYVCGYIHNYIYLKAQYIFHAK